MTSADTNESHPSDGPAPLPIASRLFRSVVPGIVFALVSGGLFLDLRISDRLEQDIDAVLLAKAQSLMALTEIENNVVEIEPYEHALPAYADRQAPDYFIMLDHEGRTIARSASVGEGDWLVPLANQPGHEYHDVPLPDGRAGRAIEMRFVPLIDDDDVVDGAKSVPLPVTLMIATSRDSLDQLLRSVHAGLAGTGLALILLIIVLARRGIRTTLAPLERIGDQVMALDPTRLDQRLDPERSSAELDRLTSRFNALLERLEAAFLRERRFFVDRRQARGRDQWLRRQRRAASAAATADQHNNNQQANHRQPPEGYLGSFGALTLALEGSVSETITGNPLSCRQSS